MRFEGLQVFASEAQGFITLDEARAQMHVDDFDDAKVSACVEAACDWAENVLRQSLRPQTILATYTTDGADFALLTRSTFLELVSVEYFDGATHAIDIFRSVSVDAAAPIARAYFREPNTNYIGGIKITYKTKAPAVFPQHVKQAVLIAAAAFYDDRNAPDLTAATNILTLSKTILP
ncbi:MAG: phage gp6-like head-tail connector protein [Opitutales bacterium]|nr:phage gp6-like head-tail connector protein [Opitutales bacterium]